MKKISIAIALFISTQTMAQTPLAPTENFSIEGKTDQPKTISLTDLKGLAVVHIDSLVITNHLHQKKSVLKNITGVLLKDVLEKVIITQPNPKLLSEYYFVCIASDNYKAVFSWNELFNNETGKHVMIITGVDGKTGQAMDSRIALISPRDEATGRRYVKGLQKIIIERAL